MLALAHSNLKNNHRPVSRRYACQSLLDLFELLLLSLSPQDQLKMAASTDFYKKLAVECSAQQIAVDLFAFSSPRRFIDLATLCEYIVYAAIHVHAY